MNAFLADALVVIHLLFVVFVMTGGFLLRRWPKLICSTCPPRVGRMHRIQRWHLPADAVGVP